MKSIPQHANKCQAVKVIKFCRHGLMEFKKQLGFIGLGYWKEVAKHSSLLQDMGLGFQASLYCPVRFETAP